MWKAIFGLVSDAIEALEGIPEKDRQRALDVYQRKHREARAEIADFASGTDAELAAARADLEAMKADGA